MATKTLLSELGWLITSRVDSNTVSAGADQNRDGPEAWDVHTTNVGWSGDAAVQEPIAEKQAVKWLLRYAALQRSDV
jgi:hypothetical protein